MTKILIAEDHNATGISVKVALEKESHTVELVKNGLTALERLQNHSYELIILDIMLPGLNGYDVCRKYRSGGGDSPVLMLTGLKAIENKQAGFGSGADDYLTKPFDIRELRMRVAALLRRPKTYKDDVISKGGLEINTRLKLVSLDGKMLELRFKEYEMLEFFMKRQNQYFNLEQLQENLWSSESDVSQDAVRKCLSRMRQKIQNKERLFIVNTKNLGYRFVSD